MNTPLNLNLDADENYIHQHHHPQDNDPHTEDLQYDSHDSNVDNTLYTFGELIDLRPQTSTRLHAPFLSRQK